jgi:hypothetical protein
MSHRFWLLLCLILLQGSCGSHRNDGPPPEKNVPQKAEIQVADLQSKITKWQSNRDKLKKLLEQMQMDKTDILEKLVELGVKSESDLANNPKGQVLHGELKDIVKQIALYDKKLQDYDLAILKSESRVRSIARQLSAREAGVSDTELEELTRSMVTLDESLSSEKEYAFPIDLKDTLKGELAHYREKPKSDNTDSVAKPTSTPSKSNVTTSEGQPPRQDRSQMSAAEKAKAEADQRFQETYLNSGVLSSSEAVDARVILAVKNESSDWQRDSLQGPLARLLATNKKHPVSGLFKPVFYSSGSFDALWNGDQSLMVRFHLLDATSGCLLLARVSFSTAAKTDYEGVVSVQGTLSIIVVKKEGRNGPWVFKASGAGNDDAMANANCAKRLVEAIDLDVVFPR